MHMTDRQRTNANGLCVETKGREILARMVHGEIDAAMRIGLFDRVPGTPDGGYETSDDSTARSAIVAARGKRTR